MLVSRVNTWLKSLPNWPANAQRTQCERLPLEGRRSRFYNCRFNHYRFNHLYQPLLLTAFTNHIDQRHGQWGLTLAAQALGNGLAQAFRGALAAHVAGEHLRVPFTEHGFDGLDHGVGGFLVSQMFQHHGA